MPNSLLTGVSGLVAHQRLLDVVGHNIANMNTTAFKSQRILFSDLLYETVQPATSSSEGGAGGTNPNQIGGGVKVAQTDRQFGQGALENTGGRFDFAISGSGFFSVTDGSQNYYTRGGAFSLDEQGYLVAPGGLHVQRFSSAGEPDELNPGYQIPGDPRIKIPLGAAVEGVVSSEISVSGNLNARSTPPSTQSYRSASAFLEAGAPATGATLLNSIDTIDTPYANGDTIIIEGSAHDGSQVFGEYVVNAASTLQDLADAISNVLPSSSASIEQGALVVSSDNQGASALRVSLRNSSTNVASGLSLSDHQFQLDNEGEAAGSAVSIVTVYDVQGGAHELTLKFDKKTDDSWTMTANMNENEGLMIDAVVDNIVFSDTGSLIGSESPTITMQFNGIAIPQTVSLNFGDASSGTRLSHFTSDSSVSSKSDGSAPGSLIDVQVDGNGELKGIASNGKVFTLAKMAIAGFSNTKGLVATGDNLYVESLNSGQAEIGEAGVGGRGKIAAGQLESSNVDVALEFTKLIVAQTGYNANARTISVSSELLEELTNIIR